MDLVKVHGNNYHRPKCKFYKPGELKISDACNECKTNNKPCEPPKDLDENGDIPENERIQIDE